MKVIITTLAGIGLLLLSGCATSAPTPSPAPTIEATPTPLQPTPTPVPPTSTPTFVPPTPAFTVEVTKDVEYVTLLQAGAPVQKLDV
jgi:PBP1b-binding outer membrane lipoprotein LpoB